MDSLINPVLLQLAEQRTWENISNDREKVAVVPPDPSMGAGGPAGVPVGGAAAAPMDPSMMGGAPPMDPAMMGGAAPPMDPAMAGGAPPMDPAMMGGAPPPMPADPAMMGADPAAGAAPAKMKPEQMMQMLDFRLYNLQQQLTAMMNAMDISLPPGALVTPPGSPTPVAEAAIPGGPQDPSMQQPQEDPAAGGGGSAIAPIGEIAGASPELAAAGGPEKMAHQSISQVMQLDAYRASRDDLINTATVPEKEATSRVGTPYAIISQHTPAQGAEAVAALLRNHVTGHAHETRNT